MQIPFGVIDADGHIVEDQARIREYMPEPYNGFLMDNLPDAQGRVGHGSAITNRAFSDSTLGGRMGGLGPAGYPFPKDWLDALEWGGMEMTFLFPTTLLTYGTIWDPDYLKAVTSAYNHWIADEWMSVSPKLKAVSLVPLTDVDAGTKEMRRTVTEAGFSGVMLPAVGFGGFGERKFDPFFEEAQSLGCLVAVHGGTSEYMKYSKFIQRHTTAFPISNMLQSVHMVYGGVFERFPDPESRIPGDRVHVGTLLPRQDGRGVGEAWLARNTRLHPQAQRVPEKRQSVVPRRTQRDPRSPGNRHPWRGFPVLRLGLAPLGQRIPGERRALLESGGPLGGREEEDPEGQLPGYVRGERRITPPFRSSCRRSASGGSPVERVERRSTSCPGREAWALGFCPQLLQ